MKILSFSRSTKALYSKLEDRADIVLDHLLKTLMYPDVQEVHHWITEIYNNLNRVPRLQSSNKYPKSSDILEHTWYTYEDAFDGYVRSLKRSIKESPVDLSNKELYDLCETYFVWLSQELSKYGAVGLFDIEDKLRELQGKS